MAVVPSPVFQGRPLLPSASWMPSEMPTVLSFLNDGAACAVTPWSLIRTDSVCGKKAQVIHLQFSVKYVSLRHQLGRQGVTVSRLRAGREPGWEGALCSPRRSPRTSHQDLLWSSFLTWRENGVGAPGQQGALWGSGPWEGRSTGCRGRVSGTRPAAAPDNDAQKTRLRPRHRGPDDKPGDSRARRACFVTRAALSPRSPSPSCCS